MNWFDPAAMASLPRDFLERREQALREEALRHYLHGPFTLDECTVDASVWDLWQDLGGEG